MGVQYKPFLGVCAIYSQSTILHLVGRPPGPIAVLLFPFWRRSDRLGRSDRTQRRTRWSPSCASNVREGRTRAQSSGVARVSMAWCLHPLSLLIYPDAPFTAQPVPQSHRDWFGSGPLQRIRVRPRSLNATGPDFASGYTPFLLEALHPSPRLCSADVRRRPCGLGGGAHRWEGPMEPGGVQVVRVGVPRSDGSREHGGVCMGFGWMPLNR